MGRVCYKDGPQTEEEYKAAEDKTYNEPASVYITDDWDTAMEDFMDDFDDYQDINFPTSDDDI